MTVRRRTDAAPPHIARRVGDKSRFTGFSLGDLIQDTHAKALQPFGNGEGWLLACINKNRRKFYCEACGTYQPENRRPRVKGWKCDGCHKGK